MGRTRVETRARARALQALYAWDMRGGTELERVASQVWDDLAITPEERRVAGPIVRQVAQRQSAIDAELAMGETPPRVVIQEAVTLAERFGSAQSARFVNGVLDALARRMGRM